MIKQTRHILILIVLCALALPTRAATTDPHAADFFEAKVRPVLVENCYSCHSATSPKLKAGLRLDTRQGIFHGGESGTPAVVPGKLDDSLLVSAIHYEEGGLQMPPKGKLSPAQIADIENWVGMGAPYPDESIAATSPTTAPAISKPLVGLTLAEGRKFWSFQKPREQPVPHATTSPTTAIWPHNEIDQFILAKQVENGLSPSPPADKRTLIRRATYDLLGLPPTIQEIDDFAKDASPDAFAKVVDRLLASPHYGERWGRYWLDIARYADTKGYVFEEERRYAFSYTYRDWVIRSLNEDLPYDQFLIQQIAADKLDLKQDKRPLAALGFLTLGRRFLNVQADVVDDRIDVVCRGTMALTVSCARCHDHKYDPIPTADYYSLYGVFASSQEPKELPLIGGEVDPKLKAEFEKAYAEKVAARDAYLAQHVESRLNESLQPPVLANYLQLAAELRDTPWEKVVEINRTKKLNALLLGRWRDYLKSSIDGKSPTFVPWVMAAEWIAHPTTAPTTAPTVAVVAPTLQPAASRQNPILVAALSTAPPKDMTELAKQYAAVLVKYNGPTTRPNADEEAIRLVLRGPDSAVHLTVANWESLLDGDEFNEQRRLQTAADGVMATHPGAPPRAMAMEDLPTPVEPHIFKRGNPANAGAQVPRQFPAILSSDDRKPFTQGSGRLELAQGIASRDNPLTARVMVNRVWQNHFGFGLVRTPGDFGTRGDRPTHPELLDWLALRFENEDGWSLKKLHREVMLSAAYQQVSIDNNPAAEAKDPENRLLWRQNPRRLDFEAMRDSLLVASGQIDLSHVGGQSVDILAEPFSPRRTIYAFVDRQNLPGTFRTFDFASPDSTSSRRFITSVPQQALFMMNSPFTIQQAKNLAARSESPDPSSRVAEMYRIALGRDPAKNEVDLGVKFIQTEQAQPVALASAHPSPWQYGYGEFDKATGHTKSFNPLPHFSDSSWRGGSTYPDPTLAYSMLSANGGHVGKNLQQAVIRRWIAPRDCTVQIDGKLTHDNAEGDGVRGRLVTSHDGLLAEWRVHQKSVDTNLTNIAVKSGDTIDFIVDCGDAGDYSFDSFGWKVTITKVATALAQAGDDTGSGWDSASEFAGPKPPPAAQLSPWEKYAQVLLESNEFAFVD